MFAVVSTLEADGRKVWVFDTKEEAVAHWRQRVAENFNELPEGSYEKQEDTVCQWLSALEWLFVEEVENVAV